MPSTDERRDLTLEEMLARLADVRARKTLLDTDDLVKITGKHEITVYRWRSQGLKAHTVRPSRGGRANRYKPDEVEAFLRQRFGLEPAAPASGESEDRSDAPPASASKDTAKKGSNVSGGNKSNAAQGKGKAGARKAR